MEKNGLKMRVNLDFFFTWQGCVFVNVQKHVKQSSEPKWCKCDQIDFCMAEHRKAESEFCMAEHVKAKSDDV
jgi:hypothetical protein